MSQEILLPKIGFSMDRAKFVEWLVDNGSEVKEGEPLFAIESEKAVEEVPAATSGVVKHVAVPDEEYDVGAVLGTIE
ncbi:dihydrolipoamide acyltransferase [Pseudomaricurvus alkylphenolicus]|jgi:pyruvate/2-oxoglutarate dehydrogenase complex dihydrolipoamide acyltransferase (E2) component|uniref:biotin/lipoyl-containing protein n=1 Tax=Pseudomaricurvus alkylphenolicus TaxID=1306991 RepID=UPI001421053F|nr:biotin/lipoyl-containing protein [Pseudomaricurvus alkylphenolicus]NIB38874.1 dihydrolipoamide acyltransferase [Pseudomaricurvus alkylphenolicus]